MISFVRQWGAVLTETPELLWNIENILLLGLVHYLVGVVPPVFTRLGTLLGGEADSVVESENSSWLHSSRGREEQPLPLAGVFTQTTPYTDHLVGILQERSAGDAVPGGGVPAVGAGGLCREDEADHVVPPHQAPHPGRQGTHHPAPPEGPVQRSPQVGEDECEVSPWEVSKLVQSAHQETSSTTEVPGVTEGKTILIPAHALQLLLTVERLGEAVDNPAGKVAVQQVSVIKLNLIFNSFPYHFWLQTMLSLPSQDLQAYPQRRSPR